MIYVLRESEEDGDNRSTMSALVLSPRAMSAAKRWLVGGVLAGVAWTGVRSAPLTVDISTREQARQFYRAVFAGSEGVSIGFTGDTAALRAGDTSAAFKEAVRLRVNFFRAYAGLSGEIQFNATFSGKCQQAALMASLNSAISHTPASSARGYTADAAEAAGKSNLSLATVGPEAITGYMMDAGANTDVGHRRWVLYPQTREMGTGDVPAAGTFNSANALWILDSNAGGPRPASRQAYVAWPPAGYVPYRLVFPRWSFAVAGADFSQAFVAVKRDGVPVRVAVGSVRAGYGENTITWTIEDQDPTVRTTLARPAVDVAFAVEITNVLVGGASQSYRYTVTAFDPDTAAPGAPTVMVSGPDNPPAGRATTYAVVAPTFFSRVQWRSLTFSAIAPRFDAEDGAGLGGLTASVSGYAPVVTDVTGAGAAGFRLYHQAPVLDQTLTLPDTYYAEAGAALTFLSRLGFAKATQTARVQVSLDDGAVWSDLYAQAGDDGSGEAAFRPRTVALTDYERRPIRLRFALTFASGTMLFNPADNRVGWYVDDIVLSGVRKVTASAPAAVSGTSFSFTLPDGVEACLQARGLIEAYPGDWGPMVLVVANAGGSTGGGGPDGGAAGGRDPVATLPAPAGDGARLVNLSVRTSAGRDAAALVVGFSVSGAGAKPLLVRAVGPTLGVFGVPGTLSDPTLTVKNAAGSVVLENDNWGGAAGIVAAAARLGAFALDPVSRDAAVLPTLSAGGYTTTVSPAGTTAAGVALVELYDADAAAASRLVNVSARAPVGTGADVLVVGFAVGGTGNRNVLIRAVGPTLAGFGVPGTLVDPKLEVFRNGATLSASDNWNANLAPLFASVGAFALTANSADAALALALAPGTYTVQVSGVGNTTGVALVEVYELP